MKQTVVSENLKPPGIPEYLGLTSVLAGLALFFGSISSLAQPYQQQVISVDQPRDAQTNLPFHELSDARQLCVRLGFPSGGITGSAVPNISSQSVQAALMVSSAGQTTVQYGVGVARVQCLTGQIAIGTSGLQTQITAVNGEYDSTRTTSIDVRPGDVVTLAVDQVNPQTGQPQYANVEQFLWSATDRTSEPCDASDAGDCLAKSNFQVTDYGVAYYVPENMGRNIMITVSDRNNRYSSDTITLINSDYRPDAPPQQQPVVVTSPGDYQGSTVDPYRALSGQGRWVHIRGVRYFVPYTYITEYDQGWTPYRNGYWSRDQYSGDLVWISYDPWGWMTDHYGVWRHHGVYGWIWSPFTGSQFYYRRHCVTFFDNSNGYLGWYPYYSGYNQGYVHGYNDGFRDGFWAGFAAASGFGRPGYGYTPGFTVITYNNFYAVNVVRFHQPIYVNNQYNVTIVNVINQAYGNNGFGQSVNRAHLSNLAVTRVNTFGSGLQGAQPVHAVPDTYRQVVNRGGATRNIPVGSVIDARGVNSGSNGNVRVVPPTTNGRGVVAAPVGRDAQGQTVSLPPQTQRPAQANPENPVVRNPAQGRPQPADRPSDGSQQPAPQRPVYTPAPSRPSQPAPSQPAPSQPSRPSQPAPAPSQPSRPSQPAPAPSQPSRPSQPAPAPSQPSRPSQPAPAPSQPSRPSQPAPAPSQPSRPSQPAPAPSQPSRPSQPAPAPSQPSRPSQPAPAPSRPSQPAPAPSRPSQPVPAPSRPAPSQPSRPSTSPAPSRPSQPSQPAPSRPSAPRPR